MTTTFPEMRFDSKPENIAVVERLIDRLSEDSALRARMGAAALTAYNDRFTPGAHLDHLHTVLLSAARAGVA